MNEPNQLTPDHPDRDLGLLLQAMVTTGDGDNPTYTLPERTMREYARLVREDERRECMRIAEEYVRGMDAEYFEIGNEIAGHIQARGGDSK